ncbi:MAG TPA: hypothetical protein VGO48_17280 [Conexibacter sp.]|jgi:hypothetical protein|nr:hypothetical protein [Conexibacter sp.]
MTRRRPIRSLAGPIAGIALAFSGGDAVAAPSWSSPQTIARPTCPAKVLRGLPPTRVVDLHAEQNARGDRLVAWVEQCPRGWRVDAGGGEFALAANARGEAVLAWKHQSAEAGAAPVVVAALRRAGAPRFDGEQRVSAPLVDVQNAFGGHDGVHPTPAAAVADDGSAIVAWRGADASAPDCCSAIEATVRASGEAFAPAARVSAPYRHNPATGPAVAMADDRTAYVACGSPTSTASIRPRAP